MNYLQKDNTKIKISTIVLSLFAILNFIYFDFVGQLKGSELLALVTIIFLILIKVKILKNFYLSNILIGYILLLIGLIASDIYNETLFADYARGWAMTIFGLLSTLFLTILFKRNPKNIYTFLFITFLASIIFNFTDITNFSKLYENTNFFKSELQSTILPIVALVTSLFWKNKKTFSLVFLFICGFLFMSFDARSSGASLIIAGVILLAHNLKLNFELKKVFFTFIFTLFLLYGFYIFYVYLVLFNNFGGSNAQQLMQLENPYNPIYLLAEGRATIFTTIDAIKEKPLLGYGSWAKFDSGEIIPKHSVIFGAWLWGGIFGFLGMFIVGWSMLRIFIKILKENFFFKPILVIYFFQFVWHFFFSPLGHVRTTFPFTIAILVIAIDLLKDDDKKLVYK